jgi:hypothetical protein
MEVLLTKEDKRWIGEQLERVETKLLTAFHEWAAPTDARLRAHSAAIRALDVEQESNKDRLDKLGGDGAPSA